MSGIMHKIGETLHIGGDKKDEHKGSDHKPESHGEHKGSDHKPESHGEHKEGLVDKIKDKIHGDQEHSGEGEKKKKKKEKKKHHEDGHHSSSSSDSD